VSEPTRNRWRGVPADARTAERRASLVDVAFELVGTEGMAGTTVRKVCEAARLNPRYFYESFEDLDALVVAVFDRTALEAVGVMMDALAVAAAESQDDDEVARRGIGAVVRHVAEDPRRARVLFMEGLNNEALGRRRFDTMHDMAETMVSDARTKARDTTGTDAVPSIVVVAANMMVGGMAELLMSWVVGRLDVTIDELVDDAAALVMAIARSIDGIVAQREQVRSPGDGPDRGDLLRQP
jgi:AcrR family transcriptional regulator